MPSLDELRRSHPFASEWGELDILVERVSVREVTIHVAGIAARGPDGDIFTGSAASLETSPIDRAYFELLERGSVVAMGRDLQRNWLLKDLDGTVRGRSDLDSLAPSSPDPSRWRYARSNGVAVAASWQKACTRALWELVERDRVLRSWYGELAPRRIDLPTNTMPVGLAHFYEFEAYEFDAHSEPFVHVAAVFGFPKQSSAPMLYAFAGRDTLDAALAAAASECLQRLGFLWGEEIPSVAPAFSPSPEYHQEFFLQRAEHSRLRRWLAGDHERVGPNLGPTGSAYGRLFADITPVHLSPALFVAKAMPDSELPLVFGLGHPSLPALPERLRVHPIA
jgi:hypothetical protein